MAKKKLKICIKLILENDTNEFDKVTPFKPDSASNMLSRLRTCLNEIYGIAVGQDVGFENLNKNSFNTIDVETEDIDT